MNTRPVSRNFLFRMAVALCCIGFVIWPAPAFSGTEQDSFEPDDTFKKATITLVYEGFGKARRHNFHDDGDEDWVRFMALPGYAYEIEGKNIGARSDVGLELYGTDGKTLLMFEEWPDANGVVRLDWSCKRIGVYYVRVRPNDPTLFGPGTGYGLTLWIPTGPPGSGNMTGYIKDAASGKPVPKVAIKIDGKTSGLCVKGFYVLSETAGDYTITLTARGYRPFSEKVKIPDSRTVPRDFELVSLKSPDLVITTVSGPAEGGRGKSIPIAGTVKNQGRTGASGSTVGFFLSKDRTIKPGQDRLLGSLKVQPAPAGASVKAATRVKIPANVAPGTYYLGAVADFSRSVVEAVEDNNTMVSKQTIQIR
jgi:hypothetical protein